MKIAIPLAKEKLAMHFGHCGHFAFIDVDTDEKRIVSREDHVPPLHEPGVLPRWLAEKGANLIIAGGMGQRAQALFAENGIDVLVGASSETPEVIVASYMDGSLSTGVNMCDH